MNIKDIFSSGQLLAVNIAGVLGAIKCCFLVRVTDSENTAEEEFLCTSAPRQQDFMEASYWFLN